MSLSRSLLAVLSPLAVAVSGAFSGAAIANDAGIDSIEVIEVHGQRQQRADRLGSAEQLLQQQGVDFSAAGGVSALPVMRGMMGDRVKVLVDGADITAACANQMNPPLSYVSANQIANAKVIAGVSPVSMAGDNIAGVISVNSIAPQFNQSQSLTWQSGYLSAGYRTNGDVRLLGAGLRMASDSVSLAYDGSYETANSYDDGNGDKVLDTLYRAQNHALTGAWRDDKQQIAVKLTHQYIPYQGYPNQYMDMTNNRSVGVVTQYRRQLTEGGDFQAQLNWHRVKHEMGFFTDEKPGMMPMNTEADDYSYQLQWQLPLSSAPGEERWLHLGHEFYEYQLDDWWPGMADSMMMGPNDYLNINNGKRRRIAAYAELEQKWSSAWRTQAGVRVEHVSTDSDQVQPYNRMPMMGMPNMDAAAADVFNASDRSQADTLVDVTLAAEYRIDDYQQLSIGLARKNRAPNLYERYSWGRGVMATTMIGWFGDANGYVGRIDLQPETAHTLSLGYQLQDVSNGWQLRISPYYTRVNDFIDADVIGEFSPMGGDMGGGMGGNMAASNRNTLQFSNFDATLYGVDVDASWQFWQSSTSGEWSLLTTIAAVHGERDHSDQPLYQIKPLQTQVALQQQLGDWQNSLSWQWLDSKTRVDPRRLENQTASYSLLNWTSQWRYQQWQLSFAVTNLLDEYYQQPLGGVSIAEFNQDSSQGFTQLAGAGRSFNFALRYNF
ncbi:TonB-dependent receptor [Idiomarina xiamenensis 10-D-4]|uniref:TonB-dependent receptor n=2 Tax=Idiomarina xiamenensis TaxID=1207041 RepID=K2JWS4_9GAMM|nr:TonB-dependent receptor [Idiomarina xiamenensis 10-D-4]